MKPSFREEEDENHRSAPEGSVSDCPEGTVPIIRETSKYGVDVRPFVPPYPFNTSRVHLDSSGIDRDQQEVRNWQLLAPVHTSMLRMLGYIL